MAKRKLKLVEKELEEAYARNGRIDIELQEKEEYYKLACVAKRDAQRNLRLEQEENGILRNKCHKLEKDLEAYKYENGETVPKQVFLDQERLTNEILEKLQRANTMTEAYKMGCNRFKHSSDNNETIIKKQDLL